MGRTVALVTDLIQNNCTRWCEKGGKSSFERARKIVDEILNKPGASSQLPKEKSEALDHAWRTIALEEGGMDEAAVLATLV